MSCKTRMKAENAEDLTEGGKEREGQMQHRKDGGEEKEAKGERESVLKGVGWKGSKGVGWKGSRVRWRRGYGEGLRAENRREGGGLVGERDMREGRQQLSA